MLRSFEGVPLREMHIYLSALSAGNRSENLQDGKQNLVGSYRDEEA